MLRALGRKLHAGRRHGTRSERCLLWARPSSFCPRHDVVDNRTDERASRPLDDLGSPGGSELRSDTAAPTPAASRQQNFAFCLVVMLKSISFFKGRNACDFTPFEPDHACLDDLYWLSLGLPDMSMFWRVWNSVFTMPGQTIWTLTPVPRSSTARSWKKARRNALLPAGA